MFLDVYLPGGESLVAHQDATERLVKAAGAITGEALVRTASREHRRTQTIEVRSELVGPDGDVIVKLRARIDDGPNPYDRGMWIADAIWERPPWPGGALELCIKITSTTIAAKVIGAPAGDVVRVGEAMAQGVGAGFDPRQLLYQVRFNHGRRPDPELRSFVDGMRERGVTLRPDELSGLLSEAVRQGSAAWVNRLLQEGADPNARSPWQRPTWSPALVVAAQTRDLPIIELLLAAGADVDVRDSIGRTPLMKAVLIPSPVGPRSLAEVLAVVDRLARAGADPNARADDRWPLLVATSGGKEAVPLIRRLIELGADPALTDAQGRDTATIAEAWNRDPEIVVALRLV